MQRILVGVTVVALVGFLLFKHFNSKQLTPREMVASGVEQVKAHGDITPKQEVMLRVQLAVADYTATRGKPPQSVEDLIPKYFDALPVNPENGQPISSLDGSGPSEPAVVEGADVKLASASSRADEILKANGYINPNTMQMNDFVYDPTGKRDPFQPFDFSGMSDVNMDLPPLQRYSIGQLKVTAILKDQKSGDFKAFVEDATGIGYPVTNGTRIGTAEGVVVKITEDAIYVVETRRDITGGKNRTTVQMKLQRAQGEDKNAKFQRVKNRGGRTRNR